MAEFIFLNAGLPVAKGQDQTPDPLTTTVYLTAGLPAAQPVPNAIYITAGLPVSLDHGGLWDTNSVFLSAGLRPELHGSVSFSSAGLIPPRNIGQSPTSQVNTYYLSSGLMAPLADPGHALASSISTIGPVSQQADVEVVSAGSSIPIIMHHRRLMGVS